MGNTAIDMKRIAILNALDLSSYAAMPLAGGPSAFQRALNAALALPEGPEVIVLANGGTADAALKQAEGRRIVRAEASTLSGLVAALGKAAEGHEDLILVPADDALMDPSLAAEVIALHRDTVSEFTFADGYPEGSAPEVLRVSAIPALAHSADKADCRGIPAEPLYAAILKDVNAFDVETVISPIDMRAHRLSYRAASKAGRAFLDRLLAEPGIPPGGVPLLEFLERRRDLHRSLPAYYAVQVTEACPQACSYCPYPSIMPGLLEARGQMPVERFRSVVEQASALSGDAVIGLSPWGEPGMHRDIVGLCAAALEKPGLSLLIETSGLGWKDGAAAEIAALPGADRIDWVVSLDSPDEAGYRSLRGEGFQRALGFAERLLSLFPSRVYPQAVRMRENEEALEAFYRGWKERAGRVIIQKYDRFSGFLPDREVCDLSPLKRGDCWHVKRDLVVRIDGSVPLCREDLRGAFPVGNAFEGGGLAAAWDRMGEAFASMLRGESPSLCGPCDEHYTFNY